MATDLLTLKDFDDAFAACRPGEPGLSEPQRLVRFAELAELHNRRARFWSELADQHQNDRRIPMELIEAARQAATGDRMQAQRWRKHGEMVADRRR